QLFAGIMFTALTVGLAALQKAVGDSLWPVNMTIGVIPPVLVICLAINLFRVGGRVLGDLLHREQAHRLRGVLRRSWIATLAIAVLTIGAQAIGLVSAGGNVSTAQNLSFLDTVDFLLPIC